MSEDTTISITVLTACSDSEGSPVLVKNIIETTEKDFWKGYHYSMAEELLQDDDYEGPFVHFDDRETGQLFAAVDEARASSEDDTNRPS